MHLTLHSRHGVAPALTACQVCGKDGQDMLLLGHRADSTMRKLYEATDGQYGSLSGYEGLSTQRVPHGLCTECQNHLESGGCIVIGKDTGQYLKLGPEDIERLHGMVGDDERRIDFKSMVGKIWTMEKAFWYQDDEGIKMRDPKEWMD